MLYLLCAILSSPVNFMSSLCPSVAVAAATFCFLLWEICLAQMPVFSLLINQEVFLMDFRYSVVVFLLEVGGNGTGSELYVARLIAFPALTDPLGREAEEDEDGVLRGSPADLTFASVSR